MGSLFVIPPDQDAQQAADSHFSARQNMRPSLDSSLGDQGLATEQRSLLDLIDKLQFAQLDDVKLPQIVVVGDQSAGKSSVLEALTGTPFPREAGACTRFATEIRMRRAKETRLKVSIIPDKNRPQSDQARLLQYGGDVTGDTPFDAMMRDATELIAPRSIPGRFAARDILVVEKSGKNDYVQTPSLKKARHFDPKGSRTIGVLTKPDMTERIGLEDKFIELVTNKDQENSCKLGWFVLLNPGPGEQWQTPEDRANREAEFFSRGKWATLPPEMWGIGALRAKLSTQLQRHIGKHVKTLRRQIQQALEGCETQLKAMGVGKDTPEEMRFQMGELFTASNNLVTPAVNGNYKNPFGERFFARQSSPKGTPSQKLRARIRDESERFAKRFRQHGRKVTFQNPPPAGANGDAANVAQNGTPLPSAIGDRSKKDFAEYEVEPLLRQIRGNELPLDSNPRAPYILFQDYSRNWPVLAQEYKDNVGVICNEFLADVIDHVWPMRMRDPLRMHFLELRMKELYESADTELGRLTDDMELEIQPFDPEYEERLRKWRAEATENGGTYTEAEEVLEKMLIYYDLTARIFTRNVITQVVERHLLLGMLRLFNPIEILRMQDTTIEAIAAENKETRERRKTLQTQKKAIEEAKAICASLAMRSELRAYEDDPDDDAPTDDEEQVPQVTRRQVGAPQSIPQNNASQNGASQGGLLQTQPTPQPRTSHESSRRNRDSRDERQEREERASRPPVPTQDSYQNGYRQEPNRDWEPVYHQQAQQAQPGHAPPPPPPRPSKVGLGDEGYGRQDSYNESPGRSDRREGARHRLVNAMRMGN